MFKTAKQVYELALSKNTMITYVTHEIMDRITNEAEKGNFRLSIPLNSIQYLNSDDIRYPIVQILKEKGYCIDENSYERLVINWYKIFET